ncbi:DNA translocase FtsK [Desulfuromonas versatilis]|uniref:DNA translocase FtsK n=1 Tax=Desulfuromonas versatilis TaxID=2802975 RepID=A0ABM8HZY8_9BACT|nr:DNA translocase FtsK [Desulfuromonas versatilis]BCR06139.1 DNA translocase FtsK [Desulfuromonas versatilis]
MAKEPAPFLREHIKKEICGVCCLALGIFLLLCFVSFNNSDPSFNNNLHPQAVKNFGGVVGAHLADLLFQLFGLPAYLLTLAFLLFAWRLLKFRDVKIRFYKVGAFLMLLVSLDGLVALRLHKVQLGSQTINEAGGAVGRLLVDTLSAWLNLTGAAIFLSVFFLVSLMLVARFSMVLFLEGVLGRFGGFLERRREAHAAFRAHRKEQKQKKKELEISAPIIIQPEPRHLPAPPKPAKKKKGKESESPQESFEFLEVSGSYHKPPTTLLDHDGDPPKAVDKDSLMMNARILESKLKDFNVEGEVVEVKPGPVVTMYEFSPAPGVKVNKIANLSDDLSMALKALSIRIVAPIPGRGVVGIEIPNKDRETVYLKEIIDSEEFQKSGGRLPMALGHDIFGRTVVADLVKMPHLLVAGSTGSGKSVSINTMVLSLLYRATPEDVRIIMVDPKMLELSIYEGIPHLLLPVVTNPKKAALALNWAVREMERRYKLMSDKGVRNIDGYNKKIAKEEKEKEKFKAEGKVLVETVEAEFEEELPPVEIAEGEELDHGHLPYIVVIVDELADLMMVAGREIEESIARLAQMARAAGIHLILATQRPSVDVITGLIKANFPTRISFKVFSRTDSRTILDSMGAETLLGMGDMLYLPPGTGALQRVHGAFVSEIEVQRVVDFLKKQGEPEYDKSILEAPPSGDGGSGDEDEEYDEKWDAALALVAETRQASISMLQRRLRLGYNRAARMIEKMEQEGIVGPSDGTSRPREVFVNNIPQP